MRTLVGCFARNNILTYASAIAFQLLVALIPLAALTLILVGLVGAEDLWVEDARPSLQERVPPATFLALNAAVERVFEARSLLWLVVALLVTLWEVSGSVRAVMGALTRIFGSNERRSIWHRFGLSFLLACAVIALVFGALVSVAFGGPPFWPLAVALVWLTFTVLIRFAPANPPPFRWVTAGSALVVLSWLGTSLLFGFYVGSAANFESAFGFVAAGLILTGYLYASAIVFLVGAQLDALASTSG